MVPVQELIAALLGHSRSPFPLASRAGIAQTKLKLVLKRKYQGPQGMFFLEGRTRLHKAEGLEVTIDRQNTAPAPRLPWGKRHIRCRRRRASMR